LFFVRGEAGSAELQRSICAGVISCSFIAPNSDSRRDDTLDR
jgi:hypothetical protein